MHYRQADDLGTLAEDMTASILRKVGANEAHTLDPTERLHVLYAVLARCEDTGGRVTSP